MSSTTLTPLLQAAFDARTELLARLHGEATDAYRLFHGSVEGEAGLTIDRYGSLLLVQTFHSSLSPAQLDEIEDFYEHASPGLAMVYNDRSGTNSRIGNPLPEDELEAAMLPREFQELGVSYHVQARHGGQDPWLFLDMRAGRRRVMQEAEGKSVLNLFAYTCGIGIAAAKAGASHVVNVDFAESSLRVGKQNARLNNLPIRPRFVQSDVFPAVRQLSGLGQPTMVRGKRMPPFPKLEAKQFDLVFLDPPRYAKSLFGVVDLVNDYSSVFKPALLATAEGGTLICCNNVAQVDADAWLDLLQRSAAKAGRTVREVEWITPEGDFPSHDGKHPLKMVLLRV
ncbi:SAM-dependent methyltransferase [Chitinimonas prasina]|uniref:SAM-dependent methyltransferase n=1 Tax=Chitinimonas prasina TaxID=1434937 RepID=A0ABQ5YB68_9NEIS|nr:class I SAM-dependent methyltransferase [Chitinimonas prasina]GLR12039.1 SAM-dependent methyltransferase [Chitinimonas prasina]